MSIDASDMRTFTSVVNWARMPPFALEVEPAPGTFSRSSRRTRRFPMRASWKATLQPITPAPTIATSQVSSIRGHSYHRRRCGAKDEQADFCRLGFLPRSIGTSLAQRSWRGLHSGGLVACVSDCEPGCEGAFAVLGGPRLPDDLPAASRRVRKVLARSESAFAARDSRSLARALSRPR